MIKIVKLITYTNVIYKSDLMSFINNIISDYSQYFYMVEETDTIILYVTENVSETVLIHNIKERLKQIVNSK